MQIRRGIVALPLLVALACTPGGNTAEPLQPAPGEQGQASGEQGGGASEAPAGDAGDATVAKPDAEVQGSCRKRPRADNTLVAKLDVVNTGNVGVIVRVVAAWPQVRGGGPGGITRWKRVRVDQGDTVPVVLRLSVPAKDATAVREAVRRDRTCRTWRRVVGAYGTPAS